MKEPRYQLKLTPKLGREKEFEKIQSDAIQNREQFLTVRKDIIESFNSSGVAEFIIKASKHFVEQEDKAYFDFAYQKYLELSEKKSIKKKDFKDFMLKNRMKCQKYGFIRCYIPDPLWNPNISSEPGKFETKLNLKILFDYSGSFLSLEMLQAMQKRDKDIYRVYMCDNEKYKAFLKEVE